MVTAVRRESGCERGGRAAILCKVSRTIRNPKRASSCPLIVPRIARSRREDVGDIDCKSLHLGPEIDATQ